jgi:hypothetical protein
LEATTLEAHDSTAANADLWTRYFEQQWARWWSPLGPASAVPEVAEGTAARVAGFLTLVAAAPIAWLFNANAATLDAALRLAPATARHEDEVAA